MARQIGFHFYSFKIWQKYTSELEVLSALRGQQDALPLIHAGLTSVIDAQNDDPAAKRMACLKRVDVDGRHLTGLLEAGGYGETSNIVSTKTGRTAHRQRTDEAAMLPCFFRLVIPKFQERGILILQRDNRVPAKQSLQTILSGIVNRFDKLLTCDFVPVANRATFERLVQDGDVQEISFVRLTMPPDFVDNYYQGRKETKGTATLSYKANRGATLPIKNFLTTLLRGDAAMNADRYELPGLGEFDFDTVNARVRVGQKIQKIDFGRRLSNPIIDVTDQMEWDRSGHPTYDSLLQATLELAADDSYTDSDEEE